MSRIPIAAIEAIRYEGTRPAQQDAYFASLRGGGTLSFLRHFDGPGDQLCALRHLLHPSPWFLNVVYGADSPAERLRLYLQRPVRYAISTVARQIRPRANSVL